MTVCPCRVRSKTLKNPDITVSQLRHNSEANIICQTLPVGEAFPLPPCAQYFLSSHPLSPSGNFSFIFGGGDTMKTAPCGAARHTQQERRAGLLGKVLHWINQPLLSLNQYCETIKGVRGLEAHTKAPLRRWKGPRAVFPRMYRVWFRVKREALIWK